MTVNINKQYNRRNTPNSKDELELNTYKYWLASIAGIGNNRKKMLINGVQDIREIYNVNDLERYPFLMLKDKERDVLKHAKKNWDLEEKYRELHKKGITMTTLDMDTYPKRLQPFRDAPYALFHKGKLPDEHRKTVAIVGARKCSPYGEKYAREYAELLSCCDVQIISGLAMGIDGIAQRGALDCGGDSYGILGCGVDICYPREHIGLYHDLCKVGGVISELPLGTQPLGMYFPMRNRIISGLSDVIIVIEAKMRSGSLITADMALEQGKEVYALPGPVNSELSRGCNELIKQGAGILNNPEELLEELDIKLCKKSTMKDKNKIILDTKEKLVYSCLCLDAKALDTIHKECEIPISEVMSIVISLELKGYAREVSKNYYVKIS